MRAHRKRRCAIFARKLLANESIVGRINGDGNGGMILGRRAHHGRPADVDIFDGLGSGAAGARDRLAEGIQVDDHQVDTVDLMLGQLGGMGGVRAAGQDAGVDARVERLDAAVEDLGKAGDVGDGERRDAELAEMVERFGASVRKVASELETKLEPRPVR